MTDWRRVPTSSSLPIDIPGPRPHVLGWGDFLPLILSPDVACPLCGVKGSHNVITLGVGETRAILKDMERPT